MTHIANLSVTKQIQKSLTTARYNNFGRIFEKYRFDLPFKANDLNELFKSCNKSKACDKFFNKIQEPNSLDEHKKVLSALKGFSKEFFQEFSEGISFSQNIRLKMDPIYETRFNEFITQSEKNYNTELEKYNIEQERLNQIKQQKELEKREIEEKLRYEIDEIYPRPEQKKPTNFFKINNEGFIELSSDIHIKPEDLRSFEYIDQDLPYLINENGSLIAQLPVKDIIENLQEFKQSNPVEANKLSGIFQELEARHIQETQIPIKISIFKGDSDNYDTPITVKQDKDGLYIELAEGDLFGIAIEIDKNYSSDENDQRFKHRFNLDRKNLELSLQ